MADETQNEPGGSQNDSAPAPGDQLPQSRVGRRGVFGRRLARGVYFAATGAIAVASVVQITQQVFFPPPPHEPAPFTTCRGGLSALYHAIDRGRIAAERGDDRDEEAALLRYREAVAPTWRHRDAVAALCLTDETQLVALDAIERLRYSEEHSVRHQAVELSALRRQVREIVGAESVPR